MNFKKINNYLNILREFYRINKAAYKGSKNLDILKRNGELRDNYNGKRIILFYTGKSIDSVDFKLFKNEYVFGCNRLLMHKKFEDLDINFYSDIDTWSYRLHHAYTFWSEIFYSKTKPGTKIFLSTSSYEFIKDIRGFRKNDTYYLSFNSEFDDVSNVSIEIENMSNIVTAGVFSANIFISIYMGFKEIYLVGADYTKDPLITGHFYDSIRVRRKLSPESVRRYEIINEFVKNKDVEIYNVVDNGFDSRIFKPIRTDKFIEMIQSRKE